MEVSVGRIKKPTEYRLVPGFPEYRVGTDGTVWSRWKKGGRGLVDRWRTLSPCTVRNGYHQVKLCRNGRKYTRKVHRLILQTFTVPRPSGHECRHLDGDPTNNALSNLVWGTPKENSADSIRHGTQARGERMGIAKLTAADVVAIRRLSERGMCHRAIAPLFKVTAANISAVVRRFTWKHVTQPGEVAESA
ncbi:MAG TPA: HNH endonuclease signature motif containing protein [Thermoguttaceae bacterium]|nr:HNH endonuclease signature motif containing protein [Thermoguttaceae bacterium]